MIVVETVRTAIASARSCAPLTSFMFHLVHGPCCRCCWMLWFNLQHTLTHHQRLLIDVYGCLRVYDSVSTKIPKKVRVLSWFSERHETRDDYLLHSSLTLTHTHRSVATWPKTRRRSIEMVKFVSSVNLLRWKWKWLPYSVCSTLPVCECVFDQAARRLRCVYSLLLLFLRTIT